MRLLDSKREKQIFFSINIFLIYIKEGIWRGKFFYINVGRVLDFIEFYRQYTEIFIYISPSTLRIFRDIQKKNCAPFLFYFLVKRGLPKGKRKDKNLRKFQFIIPNK